jgi:hypothetical protein
MVFTSGAVAPLRQITRTVPIVFAVVADPVGAGYVESLAQPGRNVTGFSGQEYALSGKWLELLKELVPRIPLHRSHPQWREAGRSAGAASDQVRVGHQPQDREGARARRAHLNLDSR